MEGMQLREVIYIHQWILGEKKYSEKYAWGIYFMYGVYNICINILYIIGVYGELAKVTAHNHPSTYHVFVHNIDVPGL
jgi:hypothetical protein